MGGVGLQGAAPTVLPEELIQYRDFAYHHLTQFGRPLTDVVWHYTDANGLIGILEKGEIYFTQIACLNDSQEQAYFGNVVLDLVRAKLATNTDATLEPLLKTAEIGLAERDFASYGRFVACFSEQQDDLNQWRGYGGGECGYAIGFRTQELFDAIHARRPDALLVPMSYSKAKHDSFAADIITCAEAFYRRGIARGITDLAGWSKALLTVLGLELDVFASVLKHPSFAHENERRIVLKFQDTDVPNLIFRQKRTLLARMLPIDAKNFATPPRLPIADVWVGPGPAQRVSVVGVGDLLLKHGYTGIKVERSAVPYRVP